MLLQIPSTISKIQTMAKRSLRIVVDTQEDLTDEQVQKIMSNYERYGYFCFLVDSKIEEKELLDLPALPPKDEGNVKSPSQRFHDRLFVYYSKTHTDKNKFTAFYEETLERMGQHYLDKLN